MKKILLVFLLSFFSPSLNLWAQIISDSLLVEGHYRSFHFSKPSRQKPGGSLVFILHGSGGNGKNMMNSATQLAQQAAFEDVLLVYPDGYKNYWNGWRKAANSEANLEDINEEAFFNSMIGYFTEKYWISEEKGFAVGTSGGDTCATSWL